MAVRPAQTSGSIREKHVAFVTMTRACRARRALHGRLRRPDLIGLPFLADRIPCKCNFQGGGGRDWRGPEDDVRNHARCHPANMRPAQKTFRARVLKKGQAYRWLHFLAPNTLCPQRKQCAAEAISNGSRRLAFRQGGLSSQPEFHTVGQDRRMDAASTGTAAI